MAAHRLELLSHRVRVSGRQPAVAQREHAPAAVADQCGRLGGWEEGVLGELLPTGEAIDPGVEEPAAAQQADGASLELGDERLVNLAIGGEEHP